MSVELDMKALAALEDAAFAALHKTADALLAEVKSERVMPFDQGTMQNDDTFVEPDRENGVVRIVTNSVYAHRLYIHPEYNFQTVNNANARGQWFEPWISGENANRPAEIFKQMLKKEL